jgi:hypothetical protein
MAASDRLILALISISSIFFANNAVAQEAVDLLPNMRPAEASDVQLKFDGTRLLFSTYSYNMGDGPLEIIGGSIGNGVQNVDQRVYRSDGSSYDRRAGTFEYHADHDHIHFDNYATYTLQPINAPGASAREGHKTTFCLMDTDPAPAPYTSSAPAYYTDCGRVMQGISVGWGDKYSWYLADQDIDVSGLPSGDYSLTIDIDPKNTLLETNDTDNSSMIYVNLDMENGVATVIDEPGDPNDPPPAPVVISDITPDTGNKNSRISVTISGSGFAPGMPVYFENGQGKTPAVSAIDVSGDGLTITATVKIGKGGRKRPSTWDLRVGSGRLSNAFTVTP